MNSSIIINSIPNTNYFDAHLPWPYIKLKNIKNSNLIFEHDDLISLVGVFLPEEIPFNQQDYFKPFKTHFIFDPKLQLPNYSKKTRQNLSSGLKYWHPKEMKNEIGIQNFIKLYDELILRRQLKNTFFDLHHNHFSNLFSLSEFTVFGVENNNQLGSMACAMRYQNEIHLIHIVNSDKGLRSNASYVLMDYLITYCAENNLMLFLGGVPRNDNGGVLRFKKRWSNNTIQTWLLRMILNPEIYNKLSIDENNFFPAYRNSW